MADKTKKINRYILWTTLVSIGLLAVLSISAAFLGADKAKLFFNSIPLAIFWYTLAILLLIALIILTFTRCKLSLLAIHTSLFLILAGSILNSQTGHQLTEQLLGIKKIPSGYMALSPNQSQKQLFLKDFTQQLGLLPFTIKLNNFRLQYHQADKNSIQNYISEVMVIQNGKETTNKIIKVNQPLHYAGYHIYQHSYDSQAEKFTVLLVTSDSGLYVVYAGYWLLALGIFWRFWFRPLMKNKAQIK